MKFAAYLVGACAIGWFFDGLDQIGLQAAWSLMFIAGELK